MKVRGFSLLELLLVLSLFAVMAALSLSVVRYLQNQQKHLIEKSRALQEKVAALQWLRQTLELAEPKAIDVDENSGRDVLWDGQAQQMRWRGLLPADMPVQKSRIQHLWLETGGTQHKLMYASYPAGANGVNADMASNTGTVLFDAVDRVEFSYRQFISPGKVSEWQAQWADGTTMPVQVRIRIWQTAQALPLELIVAMPMSSGLRQAQLGWNAEP